MKWRHCWEPLDYVARHLVVARLLAAAGIGGRSNVLDVGGRSGGLQRFALARTVAANPDFTGQVVAAGSALPFRSTTFDAVVSIDTVEHLPKEQRGDFIAQCWRLTRGLLIVAAPLGSVGHTQREAELERLHESLLGRPHEYLRQHVAHGLPTLDELDGWHRRLERPPVECHFEGDYHREAARFEQLLRASARPGRGGWRLRWSNLCAKTLWRRVQVSREPTEATNRFFWTVRRP